VKRRAFQLTADVDVYPGVSPPLQGVLFRTFRRVPFDSRVSACDFEQIEKEETDLLKRRIVSRLKKKSSAQTLLNFTTSINVTEDNISKGGVYKLQEKTKAGKMLSSFEFVDREQDEAPKWKPKVENVFPNRFPIKHQHLGYAYFFRGIKTKNDVITLCFQTRSEARLYIEITLHKDAIGNCLLDEIEKEFYIKLLKSRVIFHKDCIEKMFQIGLAEEFDVTLEINKNLLKRIQKHCDWLCKYWNQLCGVNGIPIKTEQHLLQDLAKKIRDMEDVKQASVSELLAGLLENVDCGSARKELLKQIFGDPFNLWNTSSEIIPPLNGENRELQNARIYYRHDVIWIPGIRAQVIKGSCRGQ
jgi:hypothetical protein